MIKLIKEQIAMAEEKETKEEEVKPEETKKSPNQKFKIILILCVTLVVVSISAMITLLFVMKDEGKPQTAQAVESTESDEQANSDEAEETEEVAKVTPYFYKFLPPFVVNLPTKGRVKFLQIEVEVMATEKEVLSDVESLAPLIKNDLLQLFSNQKFEDMMKPQKREELRAQALKVVNDVLKENTGNNDVKQVLFTSFIAQ